jgi:P4 family phage/plasmid primase-like protien
VLSKSLTGKPDEKFFIWTGIDGANGKSTLINFLEMTLGDYTTSVDVSLLTTKRGVSSSASPDVIRLRGKRLLTFQEPESDDKLRTGILKQFSGGDTIIARELFKAPVSFKLQGTMVMCCNQLPIVSSIDGGTWRRIRVIEFNSKFCENPTKSNEFKIDTQLKGKMTKWKPYLMSILLNYYESVKEHGISEPAEVKIASNNYKLENDKFNEYFDNVIKESKELFTSTKELYSSMVNWWSMNISHSKIPDLKEFKIALKLKYGNEKTHKKIKGFFVDINEE